MRRLLPFSLGVTGALVALIASAAPAVLHQTVPVCFSSTDAGQVPRDSVSSAVELQNLGTTTLWCALTNKADAVVNQSRSIAANGGTWVLSGVSGNQAAWCLAGGSVDQQLSLDGGANGTADGGPAGCTIISNLH